MKTTKATIKSFIRKNSENLYINVKSSFDGMTDGCESRNGGFVKATMDNSNKNNTLGVRGVRKKGEKFMDEGVCNYCYMLFTHGFQGMKCNNCKKEFFISLDILYGKDCPDEITCPFCSPIKDTDYKIEFIGGERV